MQSEPGEGLVTCASQEGCKHTGKSIRCALGVRGSGARLCTGLPDSFANMPHGAFATLLFQIRIVKRNGTLQDPL